MKKNTLALFVFTLLIALISCGKEKDTLTNEMICSKITGNNCSNNGFFKVDKDTTEWLALHCGAEYHESTGYFLIYADKYEAFETGNQILLNFKGEDASTFTVNSHIQAQYNFVVGGDSGYFPYDTDSLYTGNVIEITNLDTENQLIEGNFSVRLTLHEFYQNSEFEEYVNLTNGTFRINYCKISYAE